MRLLAGEDKAVLFSSHQLELVEELCDDVVISDHGRVMATGSVSDVRRSLGFHTLNLAFEGVPEWDRVVGPDLTITGTRTATMRLDDADALNHLLTLAVEAGELNTFSFDLPSLSDVFTHITADSTSDSTKYEAAQ